MELVSEERSEILQALDRPIPVRTLLFAAFLICYALVATVLFHFGVNPSLTGKTEAHIAADSRTYMEMAYCIRSRCGDPFVVASLARFPNTLWMPVLISYILPGTLSIAALNISIFCISIYLLWRSSPGVHVDRLIVLILLNVTTMVSLLSVNKEIVDLLVISLFCYFLSTQKPTPLFLALFIALLNRFEVCIFLLIFLFMISPLNPLRRRRVLVLVLLVAAMSAALPLFASEILADRFTEIQQLSHSGVVAFLDKLEMHYLFFLAVIPKIGEALCGEILNVPRWSTYGTQDIANSYFLLLNNLAITGVLLRLTWKKMLTVEYGLIYLAVTGCIIMAISVVNQPRYFYFCFVLFCLQASLPSSSSPLTSGRIMRAEHRGD